MQGQASEKEALDLAKDDGSAVIARKLHNSLRMYETPGEDAASISARELSTAARRV